MARRRRDLHVIEPIDGNPLQSGEPLVMSLARGLEILRAFGSFDRELGNADIARRTGLPRPTVSRLTHTLARLGYLRLDRDSGRYRLGTTLLTISYNVAINLELPPRADEVLIAASREFRLHAGLLARDHCDMIPLAVRSPAVDTEAYINVGARYPMARTSSGHAYLAALAVSERDAEIARIAAGTGMAEGELGAIAAACRVEYRREGYCAAFGTWNAKANSVAVPLPSPDGRPSYVLSVVGPREVASETRMRRHIGPRLAEIVAVLRPRLAQA